MLMRPMRYLGALAILAVGAIHLQQYIGADYRAIPTVGKLFLLNAIASAIVGLGLLAPLRRVWAAHRADAALALLALAAVTIAIGSLVALFISETGSLFGFTESGYRTPIIAAIVAEAATVGLLGPVATVSFARARAGRRQATTRPGRARGSRLDYSSAR